jgi:glyoxylase-like metal-dependent hydrolase (beta-lactamase superfamily II)
MNIVNLGYQSTNYYAIQIKGGYLLIDCGWHNTFPQFAAEFKRKGISPQDVKYILVTHFHPDHAGLVEDFKKLGAKMILMESQVGFMDQLNDFFKSKNFPSFEIKQDDNFFLKLEDSRKFLASLGLDGEVISTPGHTDDSVTLILDEGFAFTGDLHPRLMVSEEDAVTKASWDKIYQYKITRIFPGHGE